MHTSFLLSALIAVFVYECIFSRLLPVRMDWSTLSVVDLMEQRRMSAGTLSPTGQMQKKKREGQIRSKIRLCVCVCDNTLKFM